MWVLSYLDWSMFKINSNKQKHLNLKKKQVCLSYILKFLQVYNKILRIRIRNSGFVKIFLASLRILKKAFWNKLSHIAFVCRRSNFLWVSTPNSMQECRLSIVFQSHNCHFYGPRWGLLEGYFEQVVPYSNFMEARKNFANTVIIKHHIKLFGGF